MQKFLTSKAKFLYLIFFVLAFAVLISSAVYATQYADVHIYYTPTEVNGEVSKDYDYGSRNEFQWNQIGMYDFFVKTEDPAFPCTSYDEFDELYAPKILKFQNTLSEVNDFIVVAGLISLICVAGLFIISNHNRKIYYKSNVIGGIILPLGVIIVNVIFLVKNFGLMSYFNEGNNAELFNRVSVLQNVVTKDAAGQMHGNVGWLVERYSCDNTTFVIYTVLSVVVILYALFMAVYSVYRYKASTERRNEIMERAVENND